MYQHDVEPIEKFARENPDIINKAWEKLIVCATMYRCENFHIYYPRGACNAGVVSIGRKRTPLAGP